MVHRKRDYVKALMSLHGVYTIDVCHIFSKYAVVHSHTIELYWCKVVGKHDTSQFIISVVRRGKHSSYPMCIMKHK